MKLSYDSIGQWCATFACSGSVAEGGMVKLSGNSTVSACADGDAFAGVAAAVDRSGDACSVALGGMVTAPYSGASAPAVGWTGLSADGSGGVRTDAAGRSRLVICVDASAHTVTFVL
jgi:hypothetical protein